MEHVQSAFYGVTTVGTKGQIVIPAKAREDAGLKPGDQVIVFGKRNPQRNQTFIGIVPIEAAENLVEQLTNRLTEMQNAINSARKED